MKFKAKYSEYTRGVGAKHYSKLFDSEQEARNFIRKLNFREDENTIPNIFYITNNKIEVI